MLQNQTQVETVNFRLYFKVIIRQNEIQYTLQLRCMQRREKAFEMCPEVYLHDSLKQPKMPYRRTVLAAETCRLMSSDLLTTHFHV